jgi:hypothetical protein
MNADQLIAQYIKLRNYVEKRGKEHAAELQPYMDAMKAIENAGGAMLVEQGGDEGKANIVTPSGTMYRKRWTSIKVSSREDWMNFIVEDWENRERFLTTAVTKKEIEDFIEQYQTKPPGIDVSRGYNTLFNAPKG